MATALSGLLVVLAGAGAIYLVDAVATARRARSLLRVLSIGLAIVLLALGAVLAALAAFDGRSTIDEGVAVGLAGVSLGLVLSRRGRRALARLLPGDTGSAPRDWVGLLALIWFVLFSRFALTPGGESTAGTINVADALVQTLLLVGIACAAIGLFVRRSPRQALDRLGLRRLDARTLALSVVAVFACAVVAASTTLLVDVVQPGTLERLEETVDEMTGGQTSLEFGLMLGISAAVGEETLFRGALQPKYGLIFTSLIFVLLHAQYDWLLVILSLFPVGLILGLERKYLGTSAALVTHTLFNVLAVVSG